MIAVVTFITLALVAITVLLLALLIRKTSVATFSSWEPKLESIERTQERIERAVREEVALSRAELGKAVGEQRQELTGAFKTFGDSVVQRITEGTTVQTGQFDSFHEELCAFARGSGEKLDAARTESASNAQQLRQEVVSTLNGISETVNSTLKELGAAEKAELKSFSGQVELLTKTSTEKLDGIRAESATGANQLRGEVVSALNGITENTTKTMAELSNAQHGQLQGMSSAIEKLSSSVENKLEAIRGTVASELQSMKSDNAKQLEEMRQTVDEKLQSTLEKRLGESFRQVSERLEQVHKGLGEMQTLANGVGDLKKVLTNVKARGTWGEVQLGALLEQVLSPEQFATNVSTKLTGERVEFAIKLPGQGANKDEVVWLPIDAKFPIEDYQRLLDAQDRADVDGVEAAGKQLEKGIKTCAYAISDKYLDPPNTTDFGILFLPIEGLFAETIRRAGLIETIQRDCRVVVAGPTTLWSILSSLQMGFRTLAIQKRSSEVWNLLAAVKTEWTKYGDVLEAVQKKLNQASETIDKVKVRSRAVGRKLKDVQELPMDAAAGLLPGTLLADEAENGGEEETPQPEAAPMAKAAKQGL